MAETPQSGCGSCLLVIGGIAAMLVGVPLLILPGPGIGMIALGLGMITAGLGLGPRRKGGNSEDQ
ncbi:MAG: hypothetical protein AB2L09_12615 [Coriobacteriia bacterium]